MTTIIFVHGTGVRKSQYFETFEQIKKKLHTQHPDVKVVPCCWGEELGTKLNAQGASIPLYDTTLALGEEEEENEEILLWEQLYCNPFYELSLLSLQPIEESGFNPFAEQPGDLLHSRLQSLSPDAELRAKLAEVGMIEVFDEARQVVTRSEPYNQVLLKVSEESLGEYCDAVARAIVAQAMLLCEQQEKYLPILIDAKLRDEVVKLLGQALGKEGELGLGGWLWKPLSLLAHPSTSLLKYKRGAITAAFSPLPCDILLYQVRGKPIRTFIKETIKREEPPVVLLAHSLGGIACFDLLVQEPLSEVELMVTVGSQVPFLYEINALQSLPYGEPLPEHFPDWLNIYFDIKEGGPVNNALQFAHWLRQRGVPKENIKFYLSPLEENSKLVEQQVKQYDLEESKLATKQNLSEIITNDLSQKEGDLLIVRGLGGEKKYSSRHFYNQKLC